MSPSSAFGLLASRAGYRRGFPAGEASWGLGVGSTLRVHSGRSDVLAMLSLRIHKRGTSPRFGQGFSFLPATLCTLQGGGPGVFGPFTPPDNP